MGSATGILLNTRGVVPTAIGIPPASLLSSYRTLITAICYESGKENLRNFLSPVV